MLSILKNLMSTDQAAKLVHKLLLLTNAFLYPVVECKR